MKVIQQYCTKYRRQSQCTANRRLRQVAHRTYLNVAPHWSQLLDQQVCKAKEHTFVQPNHGVLFPSGRGTRYAAWHCTWKRLTNCPPSTSRIPIALSFWTMSRLHARRSKRVRTLCGPRSLSLSEFYITFVITEHCPNPQLIFLWRSQPPTFPLILVGCLFICVFILFYRHLYFCQIRF